MNTILMDGIVGVDIMAKDIMQQLEAAAGDITFEINSPGGYVFEAISLYNAIKNYKKGKITANISFAASAMTHIALAADKVRVYDNAVFMVHNPWSTITGDYREMEKSSFILRSLARIINKTYAEKTGKSENFLQKVMDEETYFYGEEIVSAGFADEVIQAKDQKLAKEDAVAFAYLKLEEAARASKSEKFLEEQVAALGLQDKETKKVMNIKQLQEDHPGIFSEVLQMGVNQERERVCAHLTLADASGDTALAVSSIQSGDGITASISAKHMAASMRRREISDRGMENVQNLSIKEEFSEDEAMARALAKQLGVEYA